MSVGPSGEQMDADLLWIVYPLIFHYHKLTHG